MSAISAVALERTFKGGIKAVQGIDLDIPEGEIYGFLGPNGAGKTTTVRMLVTLLKPTGGSAIVARSVKVPVPGFSMSMKPDATCMDSIVWSPPTMPAEAVVVASPSAASAKTRFPWCMSLSLPSPLGQVP